MNSRVISIIGVLCLVLLALTTVSALTVNGAYYSNLCQCDTVKEKYTVCATVPGTYNISVTGSAAKWLSIAPTSLTLAADACGDFYTFITPECYANSGSYNSNIIISGPEDYNQALNIFVRQCHTFEYNVTPQVNSSNPCVENIFDVSVKNTGRFTDEYVLQQQGLESTWATYPQQKFLLNPYEQFNTQLKVKSTCNAKAGDYNFRLNLSNTRTDSSDSKNLIQNIQRFIPISFDGLFLYTNYYQAKSCEEFDKNVVIKATNLTDKNDMLTVYLLDLNRNPLSKDVAYFENNKIVLDVNKPVDVSLIIKKQSPRTNSGIIVVYSRNYDTNYEATFDLVLENCYDLNVSQNSTGNSACLGPNNQTFVVANRGTQYVDVNVSMNVDGNIIETKALSLEPNSNTDVSFVVTPKSAGTVNETVLVKSQFGESQLTTQYKFDNCYDSAIQVDNISICEDGEVKQNVTLTNKGTITQNYRLSIDSDWLEFSQDEILIDGGESKTVSLVGEVPEDYSNTQIITAQSVGGTLSKTINVTAIPEAQCHDLTFDFENVIDANCCDGTVIPLVITNSGYFDQRIRITSIVPPWVTVSEDSFNLDAKESFTTYVYVSPPAGTQGDYNAKIKISNNSDVEKEINFVVRASGASCKLIVGGDVNISNNVSDTKVFTRKEVTIDFVISNDSNVGFIVNNVIVRDMNALVDFNRGVFLLPGESIVTKLTAKFAEGEEPVDKTVSVLVETSAGNFEKTQMVPFASGSNMGVSITGWFSAYTMPIVGLLFLVLLILIVVALVSSKANSKKPKLRK